MKEKINHSRTPLIIEVPIRHLVSDPDFVADERYRNFVVRLLRGDLKVALTRVPTIDITSGYFIREGNQNVHISNLKKKKRQSGIQIVERLIREGGRPLLDLYWSPLAPGAGGYVCPDDEPALAAYRNLKFALVPCRILNPKTVDAPEASVWLEMREDKAFLAKVVPPVSDKYGAFFGETPIPFQQLMQNLITKCRDTRNIIIKFHRKGQSPVHYHEMLYAFLRRHETLLDSVARLIALGRSEHAGSLTRVGYEAFLNFYIDWLSPEFMGPRLQVLSAIRHAQSQGVEELTSSLPALTNFVGLLENASEKARISPLGSFFHKVIYPSLSLVVHQSYVYLEDDASFDDPSPDDAQDESYLAQLSRVLDVLTAALVFRIRNDVGRPLR